MQKRKPKPAKGPPRPHVGNEPIDRPDMLQPEKRKRKQDPRPGMTEGQGTAAERGGSLEKAPGE